MCSNIHRCITILLVWSCAVNSMSIINAKKSYFLDNNNPESEIADLMYSKGYLPKDKKLSKSSTAQTRNDDNDVAFILSKLSDAELVKLLSQQPKKSEYDLNDLIRVAIDSKSAKKILYEQKQKENNRGPDLELKKFGTIPDSESQQKAYFRLDDKKVTSNKNGDEPNYQALQKLNSLLSERQTNQESGDEDDEERKELLFDVLVAQLKTLCCKSGKSNRDKYKYDINDVTDSPKSHQNNMKISMVSEQMFLILNDEIRGNSNEDIISVDPDSLNKNSSVLLLGPITTPLTDSQLKAVMKRISNELSKPEYLPLLRQLSEGILSDENIKLMKSLVSGPDARRYIKPHRCNHQSKLARVYGGPKWLICTGYLNLNRPSLYD